MFICEIMFGQRLDIQSTEIHPHRSLHSLHCKQTAIECDTSSINMQQQTDSCKSAK